MHPLASLPLDLSSKNKYLLVSYLNAGAEIGRRPKSLLAERQDSPRVELMREHFDLGHRLFLSVTCLAAKDVNVLIVTHTC